MARGTLRSCPLRCGSAPSPEPEHNSDRRMGEGMGPRVCPWCTSPRNRLARLGPLRAVGHSLSHAAASAGIHIATPSDGAVPVSEYVICEDRLVIRLIGLESQPVQVSQCKAKQFSLCKAN